MPKTSKTLAAPRTSPDVTAPQSVDEALPLINRELSWLAFNARVLHEALDPRTPLLERVRFLGIFTSNLDEYYMKRVGGIKRQIASGVATRTADGLSPAQQLAAIRQTVLPQLVSQAQCYTEQLLPALASHGVHLLRWNDLAEDEQTFAKRYFQQHVFPVLTPLAVDPGHPFPFISNLSQSLGVVLRHPKEDEKLFARIKVPPALPKLIRLPARGQSPQQFRFIFLQDLIQQNLDELFPDMKVLSVMPFRITRNADVERDEEDADDLLEMIEEELRARRFGGIVRLEHSANPDPWILQFLTTELGLSPQDVYEVPAIQDYTDLSPLLDLPLPALKNEPWTPVPPAALPDEEADIFSIIRGGDVLVHHPYESFTGSVERFIRAAADDPRVLAIKMTLYRTGDESPFIQTLIRAAERGKQVVCLVEVKARFDEHRNIQVAHMLEDAGVHVVYGIVGLKTHAKTALVVRREGDGLQCYVHLGTGNYNTGTAKLYTDLGLFTAKPAFTQDVVDLFNYLTGRSLQKDYQKLLVAPVTMKRQFLDMIEREAQHARAGKPAHILAKMNSLEDQQIIAALYKASQAGVKIELIVRGFCCLSPGVKGISENIHVVSVIGRFLEHSRIFYFRNAGADPLQGAFYIGSADWMYRNLQNRVEAITPIEDRPHRERLWQILQIMLQDQRQAWDMHSDGSYTQRKPADAAHAVGTHRTLMQMAQQRWRG